MIICLLLNFGGNVTWTMFFRALKSFHYNLKIKRITFSVKIYYEGLSSETSLWKEFRAGKLAPMNFVLQCHLL